MIATTNYSHPLVSVVMPVYNGEKYLREAVESILNQTYTNFEFLVINDGSTDTTFGIVSSYKDQRIRIINNETNIKLIASLNKGLDLAKGDYIIRMDADDVSLSNRIERQVEFMQAHPNIGVCGSFYQTIDKEEKVIKYPIDHNELAVSLLFYNPICHPTVIIRNSVILKNGLRFKEEYIHAEEYKFWADCMNYSELANIPEVLLNYREHASQISNIYSSLQINTSQKIRRELLVKIAPDLVQDDFRTWEDCIVTGKDVLYPAKTINVIRNVTNGNSKINFFNEQMLERKLARIWKNAIVSLPSLSIKEFIKLMNSSLTKIYPWTRKQKIFVFFKIFK